MLTKTSMSTPAFRLIVSQASSPNRLATICSSALFARPYMTSPSRLADSRPTREAVPPGSLARFWRGRVPGGAVSENGRLRQAAEGHPRDDRRGSGLMLTILASRFALLPLSRLGPFESRWEQLPG